MNRNNLYNKLPINDINWHVVVENFPEGITEMELFDAIKSPYPPISIILENYCAIVTYNTVKEAVESIRSNVFKKIKDKEIILHFNMNYLKKRAYRFTIFKINLTDLSNHTYKTLYYHFVQYGDILGIEKINERKRIDIYYPSQGEAKLAEKNAKECSMEIFPNSSRIITEVISPFTKNSQKLTNLAYAITIPIPCNSEDNNIKMPSFSVKTQKNKYFNPMNYTHKPFQVKINNLNHQKVNSISMRASYLNNNYYDRDDPMNDTYPILNMNMDNASIMNNDVQLSSFHKQHNVNQIQNSSRSVHKIINSEYNDNNNHNFYKNNILDNKSLLNNNITNKKMLKSNVNRNMLNNMRVNNNNNNNNNNNIINVNDDKINSDATNNFSYEIDEIDNKYKQNGKSVESKNNKIKKSLQDKKNESKENKFKNIGYEKLYESTDNRTKNGIHENSRKVNIINLENEISISQENMNKNNKNNINKEKKMKIQNCEIIDVEEFNKRILDNKDVISGNKRQKKDSNSYIEQTQGTIKSCSYDIENLNKKHTNNKNNNFHLSNDSSTTNDINIKNVQEKITNVKTKKVNSLLLKSKVYKENSNNSDIQTKSELINGDFKINVNRNKSVNENYNNNYKDSDNIGISPLKNKIFIDLEEKDDISLNLEKSNKKNDNEDNNSQIKIKYNIKTKKNSKKDNNNVISTSYNFVKFDNITLSKYCYQYHFLYKYRCNKYCESITWGGYKDYDDYRQFKLYLDNSDYSLSVLTTDLYSINNPAIIRQMAFDEVVNYNNINYIGDIEYERSMNHNLIYSQQSDVLLSNIDNQHYYIWNLKNNNYSSYNYDKDSIINLKEPSLKLQYNGILCDSITLTESSIFGLDSNGNLAKWNLDIVPSINNYDKTDICSISPQTIIKLNNNEKIKKIKTYSNNNQEKLVTLSTNNNIIFYDLKNDDFKPINNIIKAHNSDITTIDINPINSFYVLTGGEDNYIKVWDLRNPNVELISSCFYSNGINKLRWCPHLSNTFCCSSKNGIISIWSMNSLSENKPLMINNEYQSDQPIKVDFEWNPNKEQEGTIASVDKPGIKNMRDSCVQVWRPLIYTYLYKGLIK